MRKVLGGVLSALFLAGLASAQKMAVGGGLVLQPGQPVQITYTDSTRAGQVVSVRLDDGNPDHPTVTVPIQLGANGQGSAWWIVLPWGCVAFNAPGVLEVMRIVEGPDDGTNW